MTIEATIKTRLDAHAGLSGLIGTRSYNEKIPQHPTYPNIIYWRITTEPSNTLGTRNTLTKARFTFEVRASTVAAKNAVIVQLKDALETAAFVALYMDEQVLPFEDDVKVYRSDVDFSVWFND